MARKSRSTSKTKKATKHVKAAAPTKSDAEERVVEDPTHEADKGRTSPPASRRSRRAVAAKTYFEDDDSTTEEDSASESDTEEVPSPSKKRRRANIEEKCDKKRKCSKQGKATTKKADQRTPLREIQTKLASPSPPSSIKKITSTMWKENQGDWRAACALDY